jgi:exonuclease VII small subunit
MRIKKLMAPVTVALLVLGVAASVALAIDRAEYVATVEPICKKNREANDKILNGVRKLVKENKLDQAAQKFQRAARALKRTRLELAKVEKPTEDAAKLTQWLKGVKTEAELFEAVSRKLAHGEKTAAQRMVVRLVSNAKKTNNLVLSFNFRYCVFETSKYL